MSEPDGYLEFWIYEPNYRNARRWDEHGDGMVEDLNSMRSISSIMTVLIRGLVMDRLSGQRRC